MNTKNNLKKIWNFIWHDNSIWSWIVNIILAFVIVKFIIFPLLGLLLGTSFPVVAVVSGSMEHNGLNFDSWWEEAKGDYEKFNITKEEFKEYKFKNGFNKGDLMILTKVDNLKRGDMLVFWGGAPGPIIHRIVKIEDGFVQTKGDNYISNFASRPDEIGIDESKFVGKGVFRVPYLGWLKVGVQELFY